MMTPVQYVERHQCRTVKQTGDQSLESLKFVGGNEKQFNRVAAEEVFLIYTEDKEVCTVFAVICCGKIQKFKSVSNDVLFMDPEGLWVRRIIKKSLLTPTKFESCYMRNFCLSPDFHVSKKSFDLEYAKLLIAMKEAVTKMNYEQTHEDKVFTQKINEILNNKHFDLPLKMDFFYEVLQETKERLEAEEIREKFSVSISGSHKHKMLNYTFKKKTAIDKTTEKTLETIMEVPEILEVSEIKETPETVMEAPETIPEKIIIETLETPETNFEAIEKIMEFPELMDVPDTIMEIKETIIMQDSFSMALIPVNMYEKKDETTIMEVPVELMPVIVSEKKDEITIVKEHLQRHDNEILSLKRTSDVVVDILAKKTKKNKLIMKETRITGECAVFGCIITWKNKALFGRRNKTSCKNLDHKKAVQHENLINFRAKNEEVGLISDGLD